MASPSLFITGSEGFIGRALCKRCLALGIDYIPVDLATGTDIRRDVTHLMPEGCVVVHLAGLSSNKQCEADPRLAFSVNVEGTKNLIDCAREKRAVQFILASSEWVYEGVLDDGPLYEDARLNGAEGAMGVYANTKWLAEQECVKLQPYRATILRFGIVYGPRQHASDCALHNMPAKPAGPCDCGAGGSAVEGIFRQAYEQCGDWDNPVTIKIGSLRTARRFIHVEDVVSGILAAVGREGYEVFNLTGDELLTLSDVAQEAIDYVVSGCGIIESDPDAAPSIRDAPNTLARKALNWKPEYDLERGLRTLMEMESA